MRFSRIIFRGWSILVRHHNGDGGLRVVNVECAASGDQLHETGAAVVVADVERKGHPGLSGLRLADGKAEHPDNIPKPPGLVLTGDVGRDDRRIIPLPVRNCTIWKSV
jgi:hypothetical protein